MNGGYPSRPSSHFLSDALCISKIIPSTSPDDIWQLFQESKNSVLWKTTGFHVYQTSRPSFTKVHLDMSKACMQQFVWIKGSFTSWIKSMWNVLGGIYSTVIQPHIHRSGETLWIQEWMLLKWMACWKQSMSFSGSGLEKQVEGFKQQRVSLLWANIIKTTCYHSPKLLGPFYLRKSPLPELHWIVSSFLDTFSFSKISRVTV